MATDTIEGLKKKLEALRAQPENDALNTEMVKTLCDLAYLIYRSDPEQAEGYAGQALILSERTGFKKGMAESHMVIGTSYWARGDFDKALEYYARSLRICEETGDRKGAASCQSNIGNIHRNHGSYELALEYHIKALKIKEEITDKPGMAKSYNNIGIIYDEWKEFDQALDYYFKALQFFEELGDKQGIAISYNNIGVVFESQGNPTRALEHYQKSLGIKKEIVDKKGIADSYMNIGTLYEEQKESESALEYCLKALDIYKEIGDKRGIADSNNHIGRIHTRLERYDSALVYLQEGLDFTQETGAKNWEADSYKYLFELHQAQGDFEKALAFHCKYSELKEKIFSDITAEKIAQMQVRYETGKKEKEAEIYRSIFMNAVIGMYRITPDGSVLMANSALVNMLGYSSFDELAQHNIHDVRYDSEHLHLGLSEHLKGKEIVLGLESLWFRRDGSSLFIRESSRAVRDESGNVLYYEGTVEDITERKRAEDSLRESNTRNEALLAAMPEMMFVLSRNGTYIDFKVEKEDELAIPPGEIIGKNISNAGFSKDVVKIILDQIENTLKTGKIHSFEYELNIDGSDNTYDARIVPFGEDNILATVRNVTENTNAEEELRKLQRLKSIGTLAGGIAHDFNNILTGLFGNISIAKMKLSRDHPGFKPLEEAESSMNRAIHLTRQLLTFARGGEPVREDISLSELIQEVLVFDLSGSNVMPVFKRAEDLWITEADKGQLQQVFSNLIINADQAMPDGGHLYITLENADIKKNEVSNLNPGKYVKATIRDEGTGIDQKHLDRIFDPYFSTKQAGSGLGLTTVYSIVSKHEGYISVDSELGTGTTFTLYLHASVSRQLPEKKQPKMKPSTPGKTARILVMDDEEIIRKVSKVMLEEYGYTVDYAVDGKEAIKKYISSEKAGHPYNLVILDLTIPGGMGGKEAVRELLAIDPEVKAVVCSGYSTDPVMTNFSEYGFRGKLAKPFEIKNLIKEITRVMETE